MVLPLSPSLCALVIMSIHVVHTCVCFTKDVSSSNTEATEGVKSGVLEDDGTGTFDLERDELPFEAIFPTCFPPFGILAGSVSPLKISNPERTCGAHSSGRWSPGQSCTLNPTCTT